MPGLRELPPIRRARGYHLYDQRGRRYLDLSLAGGRALLGHRPDGALLELKNLLSRGLAADLPSHFEHRLAKALDGLVEGHPVVRIFANEERLVAKLAPLLAGGTTIEDPALGPSALRGGALRRWRPFLPWDRAPDGPSVALPVLPFPGAFGPAVACIHGIPEANLPPSDLVSPALLGATLRCVYDLRAFGGYDERKWAQFEAPWWERRGPYFAATCEKSEYSVLFSRLLEKGIFINPQFPGPSIAPAEFTRGELEPLQRLATEGRRE